MVSHLHRTYADKSKHQCRSLLYKLVLCTGSILHNLLHNRLFFCIAHSWNKINNDTVVDSVICISPIYRCQYMSLSWQTYAVLLSA